MRPSSIVLASAIVLASFAATGSAHAADAPLGLSISLERVAGVAYTSARPSSSSDTLSMSSFSIGGVAINPIALPRVGVDFILPMGLTLGAGLAFGHASLTSSPDSGDSSTTSGTAWLLSPRVGYAIHLTPLFDLTPRAGLTFASASFTDAGGQSCTSTGIGPATCTKIPGDTTSLFLVAASIELVAALRLTRSFNLLGGVSYDHVIAASGSATSGRTSQSQSQDDGGKYLGAQLWFGLGGYVL